MALEGTLRDFSFADILQLISLQRKTGVLTLKNEGDVVTLSFLEGKIVAASSLNQHPQDRLGLILLKRGALDEATLETALRRQEETLQRLGRILIDYGLVSQDEVRAALEQQILQIVYQVFRWTDGEYQFSQETDVDYDRDLLVPMVVDSIIMEGARMTDEWPFVEKRIPDREVVFRKVDPGLKLEVVADKDEDDLDMLGFTFSEVPEEAAPEMTRGKTQVSTRQKEIYELVSGRDSVNELVLQSPYLEFETCKALAELLDNGLIRESTPEELVRELSTQEAPSQVSVFRLSGIPWLAAIFLALLGVSISIIPHNPLNAVSQKDQNLWDRYVLQGVSVFRIERILDGIDAYVLVRGVPPQSLKQLVEAGIVSRSRIVDPWGRTYRLIVRGHGAEVAGTNALGQPEPQLMRGRAFPWDGPATGAGAGPGVILLD